MVSAGITSTGLAMVNIITITEFTLWSPRIPGAWEDVLPCLERLPRRRGVAAACQFLTGAAV